MKLSDYRKAQAPPLTAAAFGQAIGVSHGTVLRWEDGTMFPTRQNLEKIQAKTGGKVTASDFLATPVKAKPERAQAAA